MPLSRITSPFMSATANVYSPSANTIVAKTSGTQAWSVDSNGRFNLASSGNAAARLRINTPYKSQPAIEIITQGEIKLNLIKFSGKLSSGLL